MDFDEITLVVPWLELALDLGIDPDAPQVAEPRAFKSHLSWHEVPKGGRYLAMVRDPKDVLVSMYHFHEGWRFEPGAITMGDYARNFFLAPERGRRYWQYVASWWPQRGREDVLLLSYEAALADVPGTVRRIARLHRLSAGRRPAGHRRSAVVHRVHEGPRPPVRRPRGARRAQRRQRPSPGRLILQGEGRTGRRSRGRAAHGRTASAGPDLARRDGRPFRVGVVPGHACRYRPRLPPCGTLSCGDVGGCIDRQRGLAGAGGFETPRSRNRFTPCRPVKKGFQATKTALLRLSSVRRCQTRAVRGTLSFHLSPPFMGSPAPRSIRTARPCRRRACRPRSRTVARSAPWTPGPPARTPGPALPGWGDG